MEIESLTIDEITGILDDKVTGRWIPEGRVGNDGSGGNTLEDLLGVEENNLRIPDWGIYELKTRGKQTSSLVTLFHREPQPAGSVPQLIRALGWKHKQAGNKYPANEMSFRSTTKAGISSDRGLAIELSSDRIELIYRPEEVNRAGKDRQGTYDTYGTWADDIENRNPHYSTLLPVWWDKEVLLSQMESKLNNTLFALYDKRIATDGSREFKFTDVVLMSGFRPSALGELFQEHSLFVDFDARTGHNHGTKFRVDFKHIDRLFDNYVILI